jgi:hypothetical protein
VLDPGVGVCDATGTGGRFLQQRRYSFGIQLLAYRAQQQLAISALADHVSNTEFSATTAGILFTVCNRIGTLGKLLEISRAASRPFSPSVQVQNNRIGLEFV